MVARKRLLTYEGKQALLKYISNLTTAINKPKKISSLTLYMCALYSKLPSNMSTIPTIEMRNEECFIRIWSVYAVFPQKVSLQKGHGFLKRTRSICP